MRRLPLLAVPLLALAAGLRAQERSWEEIPLAEEAGPLDFRVFPGLLEGPVPPGLWSGMNDLGNAQEGCWEAWKRRTGAHGGLARIWIKYAHRGFDGSQLEAARRAQAVGLRILLCPLGAPENRGKGDAGTGIPPRSATAWAETVARHTRSLLDEGIQVSHLEIWNEPDLRQHWQGSREEFARFFATAGVRLRELLPESVRLGGPGMAAGYGGGRRLFEEILDACVEAGFTPDFLSWHDYRGYASDQLAAGLPDSLLEACAARGLPRPELILSEWNIGLPNPANPSLDNHQNAAYFAAFVSSLAYTAMDHSCFFFLQDGSWESRQDYDARSVGVFTLRGGPKAVLAGMELTARACGAPRCRVWRHEAPWNLTLLATRSEDGRRGWLLATHTTGDLQERVRKLLDRAGVELSALKGQEARLRRFFEGQMEASGLGLDPSLEPALERIREETRRLRAEGRRRDQRPVRIRLQDPPDRVVSVRVVDATHGNPVDDSEYRARFRGLVENRHARTAEATVEELRRQGVAPDELEALRRALEQAPAERGRGGRRGARLQLPGVSAEVRALAELTYRRKHEELVRQAPLALVEDPATQPGNLDPARVLRRAASGEEGAADLILDLPLHSVLLVEVAWEDPAPPRPAAEADAESGTPGGEEAR